MQIQQLQSELQSGRKIRRKGWQCPSSCVHLDTKLDPNGILRDPKDGGPALLRYEDAVADDWELVPEPDPCEEAWEKAWRGVGLGCQFISADDTESSDFKRKIFKAWYRRGWEDREKADAHR
jgi:hypothetical protein